MTERKLSILAVVAVVMVLLTVALYSGGEAVVTGFEKGQLLVQGLDPARIGKITAKRGDTVTNLQRQGSGFVVVERSNYPAANKEVNDLLTALLDIRCQKIVTDRPENHAELGVVQGGTDTLAVTLAETGGKELVSVLVGKTPSGGSGRYVRLADEDKVYLTEKGLYLDEKPTDFMETNLLDVPATKIREVTVKGPEGSYTIKRDSADKAVLQNVPEGKQPKQSDVDGVMGAISWLNLDDVEPAASAGVTFDRTFTARLKSHLTYHLRLGQKEEATYIQLTAEGPPQAILEKVINESNKMNQAAAEGGKKADQEALDKNDAIIEASQTAKACNEHHAAWVYKISKWGAGKLKKPIGDLVEDIPDPDDPAEIAARHILISYKGAERAEQTRTKEEARARAAEVLAKVKAEGADFAALAKEYSDGPSATKGGDLGTFKKGAMHKNFEAAAWKLAVGGVSDIVETPFGFHIIERTQ